MVAIHNYFNKYYVPNNMAVVLVGDFEFEPTIKLIDDTFGQLENKDVQHPELPKEDPIASITEIEVYGPTAESVRVAYRVDGGLGSEDHKRAMLIDMMLSNGKAGLMDLNLNQGQKVQRAGSYHSFLNEYGLHYLDGTPKAGQSLDEVKDLMLAELDKIKKGEFDDWLIDAVINDLKLSKLREYENSTSLASAYYNNFISQRAWADELSFLDELKDITKEDLMAYASENYGENYVLMYKRQGEDHSIAKVEKPQITPANLNRGKQSPYYENFSTISSGEIQPLFVNYKEEIKESELKNGVEVSYIENKTNDLFSLNIIFDMGSDHDKKLALAVAYMDYVGTDQLSPDEVKKEFFKLGINYGVNTGSERSYVGLSGLQENLDKGLVLLENLWDNAKGDQESYDKFVEKILKARIDGKAKKDNILWSGMLTYGIYGENSRLRDIYDTNELQRMDPNELIQMVKDLKGYKQRIFYYGNDIESTISSLNNSHQVPTELKNYPEPKQYEQIATGNQVNFVDFDMVQAEIILVAKADQFDAEKMAYAMVFNDYFGYSMSSILMQELRESKSLAYAVFAEYVNAGKKENSDVVWAYIGTQADKLPDAVDGLMVLMKDMPAVAEKFDSSKKSALKKIASQRITKSSIFWNYERLKRRGIDYDIRKDMYESIQNMTLEDMSAFFDKNVKGGEYTALVIGKKSDLDLNALKKMGDVKEMDIDYLFNYTDVEVKQ
jgi:predicted Zn-dependent peptidase